SRVAVCEERAAVKEFVAVHAPGAATATVAYERCPTGVAAERATTARHDRDERRRGLGWS
ncbi:MAG: hypothetical protein ACR2GG_10995, partial [Gemmatimonadaceae bacterium]